MPEREVDDPRTLRRCVHLRTVAREGVGARRDDDTLSNLERRLQVLEARDVFTRVLADSVGR